MKTLLYKSIIIFMCLPVLAFAGNGLTGKHTKEKKIKKEFEVTATALLKINNSYGNLYMTSWDQNKIVIEVHIKTNGNNESKVQKKLDEIDVEFDATNRMVSAKTIFSRNKWGWNWGKSNSVNVEVNYTVKLPVTNSVDLSNDYGGIYLDKLEGKASINCDYGRMELGELLARGNVLKFDYTSKSSINYVNGATIYADYSGYSIGKAEHLIIKSDYSNSKINNAGNVDYSCDYGSISIDQLKNIKGKASYLKTVLGKVNGSVYINSNFSSLNIKELSKNAGNVEIKSEYAGVKIGYAPDYKFNFDIEVEYAGFKSDDLNFTTKTIQNNEKYYAGFHGAEDSGKNVTIKSAYGGVSLKKN